MIISIEDMVSGKKRVGAEALEMFIANFAPMLEWRSLMTPAECARIAAELRRIADEFEEPIQ